MHIPSFLELPILRKEQKQSIGEDEDSDSEFVLKTAADSARGVEKPNLRKATCEALPRSDENACGYPVTLFFRGSLFESCFPSKRHLLPVWFGSR